MARARLRSRRRPHAAHAFEAGTNTGLGDVVGAVWFGRPIKLRQPAGRKISRNRYGEPMCDMASPVAAVMLHLRSCYVSKAAILTLPIQSVPVENRSPA
jgi:hypothetical protein